MVINIIDRDFNFLGQIDEYESFMPSKKWHSIGSFELHLHKGNPYASALVKENIIFTSTSKAYVISHRELNSADGKLIVKGMELKSYLARWLVFPPTGLAYYRVNSNAETIMKSYVTATLARKGVTNVVVAANQSRGAATVYQSRYKNLAEEMEKLSLASGLGWDVRLELDNKQFVFDVAEGRNITVNQSVLPPAIFSVDYDNVGEQQLIESRTNYANMAVVAGKGEGTDRAIEIVGESVGLDCYEVFVDARDIENSGDLPYRGEQKLSETQEILTFDSEVLTNRNLIYGTDYKLGDVCTIQNHDWDVSVDRRITETVEIYESSGFRLGVVFGESIPTILDAIKQATDAPIAEGGTEGIPGNDGNDGVGLEFTWNGTQLGVKREDEVNYHYVNLKGEQGEQGIQGLVGPDGRSIEFAWNGTSLGVRLQGDSTYTYVNLKGEKGDKGEIGGTGATGKGIEFTWNGTQLGIRVEGQSSYQYVDLKGAKGDAGNTGATGKSIEFTWNGTQLGVRQEGQSSYQYVNLKGDKGDDGVSPTVAVKTSTDSAYVLTVTDANGSYDTPNLKEAKFVTDQNTGSQIKVWYGTVAEFNNLSTVDNETEYNILEEH